MSSADRVSIAISLLALLISVLTFVWARIQERAAAQAAVIKALQGEKETIAYIAYKICDGAWRKQLNRELFRKDLIAALCLAFLLEGADRAKALVFSALVELKRLDVDYHSDIKRSLTKLHQQITSYRSEFKPSNFDKRVKALEELMRQLDVQFQAIIVANGDAG